MSPLVVCRTEHNSVFKRILLPLCLILALPNVGGVRAEEGMSIFVDATEINRKLLYSTLALNSRPDTLSVLYPKWIPGIHGPKGPIENLAGFKVSDSKGKVLEWERDHTEVYRFFVAAGEANNPVFITLRYICSQPSTHSRGVDSYGTSSMGIINWNTVLVYPEGIPARDLIVTARIIFPKNWQFGTALPFDSRRGDTVLFKPVTLEELMDMPVLCGEHFRTVELLTTSKASYLLHLAADDSDDLPDNDSVYIPFRNLINEAEALFGRAHFGSYHFLLSLSEAIPRLGLEHRNSSLNVAKADELREPKWEGKRVPYLIPHEFVHAWCGKYRRPAGMYTDDFLDDKDTDLLWVYEGLTQYLGYVLAVRSGFVGIDEFKEDLARWLGLLKYQKGRRWRPLQDTEHSAYTLRGGSKSWGFWRRSQDYYREGAMIWMEFDARIRNATNGEKSLDDFCSAFFSRGDPLSHAVPFNLDEIIEDLKNLSDQPWGSWIDDKVGHIQPEYTADVVRHLGHSLEFTDRKPEGIERYEKRYKTFPLYESLGIAINEKRVLTELVPGSPADIAGLYPGMEIAGINGKRYSKERLLTAVRKSPEIGHIRLLTLAGDEFGEFEIKYDGGLRYYKLSAIDGYPNRLDDILRSRTVTVIDKQED